MAIPSQVVALSPGRATVECFGVTREVSLLLLGDDVKLGDYLLVQAGGLACEIVEADRALEALALMREVLAEQQPPSELAA